MAGPASCCRSTASSLATGSEVSNQPVRTDVARCRAGMAELLTQAAATRKLERRLELTGGWPEASGGIDFGAANDSFIEQELIVMSLYRLLDSFRRAIFERECLFGSLEVVFCNSVFHGEPIRSE